MTKAQISEAGANTSYIYFKIRSIS